LCLYFSHTFPILSHQQSVSGGFEESYVLEHIKVDMTDPQNDNQFENSISTEYPEMPRIIDNYTELIGTELPDGIDQADHHLHAKKRQELFFHWIEDKYKVSHGTDGQKLPDVICSGGLLAELLDTPLKNNVKWDFHATNLGSSVLLWTEPTRPRQNAHNAKSGVMFEALVIGYETGENLWDICHKRNWAIYERKFNNMSILLLSDVDAIDENGSWVEIKLFDESFYGKFQKSFYKSKKKRSGILRFMNMFKMSKNFLNL